MKTTHRLFLTLVLATLAVFWTGPSMASGGEEAARELKARGDTLANSDDVKGAADSYVKAFALWKGFSEAERIRMAEVVSWDSRYDDAIAILSSVLDENLSNVRARVARGRMLSWKGKHGEAIEDAEEALRLSPGDKDALIVKANSLAWSGRHAEALPVYSSVLQREESFDARLGHTHALLAAGDVKGAREGSRLLNPAYPYQTRELERLLGSIEAAEKERRPEAILSLTYYNDTDSNQVTRYGASYSLPIRDWRATASYRRTDARDSARNLSADEFSARAYGRVSERLSGGAGLGVYRPSAAGYPSFLTGHVKGDYSIGGGSVGAHASSDGLSDTAQLIENGIRSTSLGGYLSRAMTERVHLYASATYRTYSDDNTSTDFVVAPRYTLLTPKPWLAFTYRLRFLDFDRVSGGGYFDPSGFVSHQLVATLFYEKDRFYTRLEPYYGHQSFERNNESTSDFFWGGMALLGWNLTKDAAIEATIEGGNYAVGSAAGFNYYMAGVTFIYRPGK